MSLTKVAVTVLLPSSVIEFGLVVPVRPPDQLSKCQPVSGLAVELDDIAVLVRTIVVAADSAAAAGVDRQGDGVLDESSGDGLVAVERGRVRVGGSGQTSRPAVEVPAGVRVSGQLDDIAVLVGPVVLPASGPLPLSSRSG